MATCIQCDNEAIANSDFCSLCEERQFKKIRGWLYLPALGLIISAITYLWCVTNTLKLLTDRYETLNSIFKGMLFFELGGFIILFLFTLYVASLFFRKKRELPRYYIAFLLAWVIFLALDYYLVNVFIDTSINSKNMRPLIRSIINAGIWIPYFCVSERVKRTFVR